MSLRAQLRSGSPTLANSPERSATQWDEIDFERFPPVGALDIATAAGSLVVTAGLSLIVGLVSPPALGALAPLTWLAAERFGRQRRLTLTTFVLLAAFVLQWTCLCFAFATAFLGVELGDMTPSTATITPYSGLITSVGATLGCIFFWMRFRYPIAYAAGAVASVNAGLHVLRLLVPDASGAFVSSLVVLAGLALFALALAWDMSDPRRETARSDMARWLYLVAGLHLARIMHRAVAGEAIASTGWDRLFNADLAALPPGGGLTALAICAGFALAALFLDRRSFLFAPVPVALPALKVAFSGTGWDGRSYTALFAFMCIACLLVFWRDVRGSLFTRPDAREQNCAAMTGPRAWWVARST